MRYFLIFLFSFSLFANLPSYMKVEDITPTSFEEICTMEKKMIHLMQTQMQNFIAYSDKKDFPAAFATWNDFYRSFIVAKIQLEISAQIASTAETKRKAKESALSLEHIFIKLAKDSKKIRKQFITMGKKHAEELSPLQREITFNLLSRYLVQASQISSGEVDEMLLALEKLSPLKRYSFATYQSEAPVKTLEDSAKIVTINTLCFPEMLSCYFGGMRPWQERIESIAEKISATEAEIVCLQEVWDYRAADALIDELEEEYAYFYYDIGNANYILDPSSLKVNSGLFVASKYPISSEKFVPFNIPGQHPRLRRGMFFFAVGEIGENSFGMINTHLESGKGIRQSAIRRQSLLQVDQLFEEFLAKQKKEIPLFLTGDLNIDSLSPEYISANIEKRYANFFKTQSATDPYTCTDFFEQLVFSSKKGEENVRPNFAAYDYFIARKNTASCVKIESQKLPMFDWKKPMEALSDHHGLVNKIDFLLSTITKNEKK